MLMDDSSVIHDWVKNQMNLKFDGLKKECMDEIRDLKNGMEKIWEENLKVPGIIGDDGLCLYNNMAEYCKA